MNHATGCKSRKKTKQSDDETESFKIKDACKSWVRGTHAAEDYGESESGQERVGYLVLHFLPFETLLSDLERKKGGKKPITAKNII